MSDIKETLDYIIKSIVPPKTDITINESQENEVTIFEVEAPEELIGKIIGKEGKTIKSIRNLLNFSFPQDRFILKIKG